jgi:hypothetical protein
LKETLYSCIRVPRSDGRTSKRFHVVLADVRVAEVRKFLDGSRGTARCSKRSDALLVHKFRF